MRVGIILAKLITIALMLMAQTVLASAAAPSGAVQQRVHVSSGLRLAQAPTTIEAPAVKKQVTIIFQKPKCPSPMFRDGEGNCQCPEPLVKKGNRCEEEKVVILPPECKPPKYINDEGKCVNRVIDPPPPPPVAECLPPQKKWLVNGKVTCITPPQIVITPTELPGGEEGSDEYPDSQLVANGGTGPYIFTVSAGKLPPGLTMGLDGLLSGIPEKAGAYGFTVISMDARQFTATWNYSITITKPEEEQVVALPGCPEGQVRFGVDCVPLTGGPKTCADDEVMRNGECVKPPAEIVMYPTEVQTELKRVGCLTGRVDGVWGGGSRTALSKFYQRARTSTRNLEPTRAAWDATRSKPRNFCPRVIVKPPTIIVSTGKSCKRRSCGFAGYWNKKACSCACKGAYKWNGSKCVQQGPSVTDVLISVIGTYQDENKKKGGGGGGKKCRNAEC